MSAAEVWAREEVEVIGADYLHMLTLELAGQAYNKTAHRRALSSKLRSRSNGSIERKHQNISAVLIELGCPYISGYKPLRNYQAMLYEVVAERMGARRAVRPRGSQRCGAACSRAARRGPERDA